MNIPASTTIGQTFQADDISEFCKASDDCYTNGNCNAMTAQIRDITLSTPECGFLKGTAADILAQTIIQSRGSFNLLPQFSTLTGDECAIQTCWQALTDNIQRRTATCSDDADTIQKTIQNSSDNPPSNPQGHGSSVWGKIAGWGSTALAAAVYIFHFIYKWRKVGVEMKRAGETLGFLAKTVRTFSAQGRAFAHALMAAYTGTLETGRYFLEKVVGDTINFFKYVKSGEWTPETQKAVRTIRKTDPNLRREIEETDPIIEPPQRNVVLSQIKTALENKKWGFRRQRDSFNALDPLSQLYLANEASREWRKLVHNDKEKAIQEIAKDKSRLPGALPYGHIESFIEEHLKPKDLLLIQTHASNWGRELRWQFVNEMRPNIANVENQFADGEYKGVEKNSDLAKYLARKAIFGDWPQLDLKQKTELTEIFFSYETGELQDVQSPDRGTLPLTFIDYEVENTDMVYAKKVAAIYFQILEIRPELEGYGFEIVNARAEKLLRAWNGLLEPLQLELGHLDKKGRLPDLFMNLAGPSLNVGTNERAGPPRRTEEPWQNDKKGKTQKGLKLFRIKKKIVEKNPNLAYYPELLEARANMIEDSWASLPPKVRKAFLEHDEQSEYFDAVSETFMDFWLKINEDIGTTKRPAIDPREGGSGNLGGGSSGPASEIPGSQNTPAAPNSSGAKSAAKDKTSLPMGIVMGNDAFKMINEATPLGDPWAIYYKPPAGVFSQCGI